MCFDIRKARPQATTSSAALTKNTSFAASGYVIATGLTAAEALARADHAATKLNIRVKPIKRNPDGLETAKRAQMLDRPTGTPDGSS